MKFYIVDAFADEIFGGNTAGVVILPEGSDFPDDATCVKTAGELRYSETAFIKSMGGNEFTIRYFTPAAEVELCGHATIGSFAALKLGGHITDGEFIDHTISGSLGITVSGDRIMMDMASPVCIREITEEDKLKELYDVMGLDSGSMGASNGIDGPEGKKLLPQIISTGLPDIMLPVRSRDELEGIDPDFKALSDLSERYGVVGVHAFTTDGDDATCHVRNFAPLYEIDEESATGTANGALTYYGLINGFVSPGDDCRFIQGEKMNRPSVVETHIEAEGENWLIRVGGRGVIVAEGEIHI